MPFSEVEGAEWQNQACEFLRRVPDETPAAKRRRLAKVSVNQTRLSTLDQLRAWGHGLRVATNRGLEAFAQKDSLDCPVGDDGLVAWPPSSCVAADKCPPVLVARMDQGPTNMCAMSFLMKRRTFAKTAT